MKHLKRIALIVSLMCAGLPLTAQDDVVKFRFGDHLIELPFKQIIQAMEAEGPDLAPVPEMTAEQYEAIKAELFALWNWGPEEIEWFNRAYGTVGNPTVNGTQEDYILAAYEIYQQTNGE